MSYKLLRLLKKNYYNNFNCLRKLNVSSQDVDYFCEIVGPNRLISDNLESYNVDWLKSHQGNSKLALFPSSSKEVSQILLYCNQKSLKLVVQAGNTSLVAGSVPEDDEVILCMGKMNKVIKFDPSTGVLQCESGCILENLENIVQEKGHIMPFDLGAKGSCQIGGNVASNAGGIRFVRYGSLHGSVLGLEVVLPDGKVLDMMSSLRKDNTGYDLKQIFIGSEGTLGVITKVSILCPVKPDTKIVTFLGVQKFESILHVMQLIRSKMNPYLTAFEMMDELSLDAVEKNLSLDLPFKSPFYVLFELSLTNSCSKEHIEEELHNFLANFMETNVVSHGTVSSDLTSVKKLWAIRERIAEALLADGKCYKYDVSLEHEHFYQLVEIMRERLQNTSAHRVCGYGHIGDNNLHLTVTSKTKDDKIYQLVEPFVFEWIRDRKGSISAEHGLGRNKRNHIYFSKSQDLVNVMKQMKTLFDPKGILNPKKMLPDN